MVEKKLMSRGKDFLVNGQTEPGLASVCCCSVYLSDLIHVKLINTASYIGHSRMSCALLEKEMKRERKSQSKKQSSFKSNRSSNRSLRNN